MAERYCTKKKGSTEVYPFRSMEDILKMINYFKEREQWDNYLTFMFGILLGRRISDTLNMRWSDIMYDNGNFKEEITTIEEMKTGKFTTIPISPMVKQVVNFYLEKTRKIPTENISDWIFQYTQKTIWNNRNAPNFYNFYEENDDPYEFIGKWCRNLNKDFSDKRKDKIWNDYLNQKHKGYKSICEYLYYDIEWHFIVKAQIEVFRKEFVKAAKEVGITYNVSTHTLRKSFGMWSKKLHPYDPDCLTMLQNIFNHSDIQTTTHYIGLTSEKKIQYFNDIGDFVNNVESGNMSEIIKNSPVISLKSTDLREIIKSAIQSSEENEIDKFNRIMEMVDNLRIQSL